ncbi:MAG: hypothetical protein V8R27_00240 [Oscillospiraceae bacterium]
MPQGSLADAGRLNESDAAVLEVRTEQEKTLYLRAYVGAELSENVWSPLPGRPMAGTMPECWTGWRSKASIP